MRSIDAACPLERLDIGVSISFSAQELSAFLELLKPHAAKLQHFSIISQFNTVALNGPPFRDHFIWKFPALETLYCAHDTYTSAIIARLPSGLRTLVLVWTPLSHGSMGYVTGQAAPFPCDLFCDAIACLQHHSLRRIQIVGRLLKPDDFVSLSAACEKKQIVLELGDFGHMVYSDELLN